MYLNSLVGKNIWKKNDVLWSSQYWVCWCPGTGRCQDISRDTDDQNWGSCNIYMELAVFHLPPLQRILICDVKRLRGLVPLLSRCNEILQYDDNVNWFHLFNFEQYCLSLRFSCLKFFQGHRFTFFIWHYLASLWFTTKSILWVLMTWCLGIPGTQPRLGRVLNTRVWALENQY